MSKYLAHVERSIARLGYIKPEYAPALASFMNELEGQHPHQIARKFRQIGAPLSRNEKKAIGLRSNADMTAEAFSALTEKGRASPIKGLETTLLDTSFAYFRQRAVRSLIGTELEADTTFRIRAVWGDCPGCSRLKDQEIKPDQLNDLPPPDCANEACALGIRPGVDFGRRALEQYRERIKTEKAQRSWLRRIFGQ